MRLSQTAFRRKLNKKPTPAERSFRKIFQSNVCGYRIVRQHPIGPYFADFSIPSVKLIIELDGSFHDNRSVYDAKRTKHLGKMGWRVIRFRNDEVLTDPWRVFEAIERQVFARARRSQTKAVLRSDTQRAPHDDA